MLINGGNTLSTGSLPSIASDITGKEWIYSSSYWTGSASIDGDNYVLLVNSSGGFYNRDFNYNDFCGVRPVLDIPVSEISY